MRFISLLSKTLLAIILFLILGVAAILTFGPVSNPKAMLGVLFGYTIDSPTESTLQQRLQAAEGFSVGQYAANLGHIRFMAFANNGDLLVSQPRQGQILLLKADANNNGRHDGKTTLLEQLRRPHGLAFHESWLYVAESDAVGRIAYDHESGTVTGDYQRIVTGLTDDGNHWSKSLLIHNGKLLVSMGSTCNVCEEADPRRATIMEFDLDGANGRIFASGLRNSVGLDAAPWSGEVYATDNGRDLLGDDYPPCELNRIEADKFYGWPYINGFGDLDPDFGAGQEARLNSAQSPVFGFPAHNAPLGMRFIRNAKVPAGYEKTALVALHGSWNRSTPDGYKVIALDWANDGSITSRDFLSGFERDGDVIGRPVDIAEGPDHCIYVSDDYAGSIYRVCHGQQQVSAPQEDAASTTTGLELLSADDILQASTAAENLIAQHNCMECHHLNGVGNQQSGKSLEYLNKRYQVDSLSEYFLTPNAPMPQYELTETQRRHLAIYLLNQ